ENGGCELKFSRCSCSHGLFACVSAGAPPFAAFALSASRQNPRIAIANHDIDRLPLSLHGPLLSQPALFPDVRFWLNGIAALPCFHHLFDVAEPDAEPSMSVLKIDQVAGVSGGQVYR